MIEIQKRANLCLPLLLFLTQTRHKYCQPIQAVIVKINRLKVLKDKMVDMDCSGAITQFLEAPSDNTIKKKREQIFEELNQMVSYVKRLEF